MRTASKSTYIRDKRSPAPKSQLVSRVMSANRATKTSPELMVRKALRSAGITGCRYNLKSVPGRPDICIPSKKLAIFINGCFWHHCPTCKPGLPKTNRSFWRNKFLKNRKRDASKIQVLKKLGWTPRVIWECQLKDDDFDGLKLIKGQ